MSVWDVSFCKSRRGQNAHGRFTRAILCGNLQEKCRMPIPRHPFCASLRSRNAYGHFTSAILSGFVLCEPAQPKCTWTFHKSHFVWEFTRKVPYAKPATHSFCASLRSRNAHGHVTRGILWGNLQEKCRYHLDWTPALDYYHKNPSVWPHCLGNMFKKNIDDALLRHRGVWKLVPGKPKYWLMLMNHYILIFNGCLLRHAQISNTHVESCCPPPTRKPAAQSPWRWSEVRRIPCRSALGAWKAPQTAPPAPGSDQHSHCSNSTVYRIL